MTVPDSTKDPIGQLCKAADALITARERTARARRDLDFAERAQLDAERAFRTTRRAVAILTVGKHVDAPEQTTDEELRLIVGAGT